MSYVLAFLGFIALIVLHEAGHFVAAKATGMRVEKFSLFFPPTIVKVRRGETEYGIGAVPLGGYVKITGMNPNEEIPPEVVPRAYYNQAVWKRVVTIAAGPAVNIVIAIVIIWAILLSNGLPVLRDGQQIANTKIEQVLSGSPAASSALRPGDVVVSANGVTGSEAAIHRAIESDTCAGGARTNGCPAGKPVTLGIRRDGTPMTLQITPRYVAADDSMEVGVAFGGQVRYVGVFAAAGHSVTTLWSVTKKTVSTVARIFEPKERKQLSGVVGSYTVTQESFNSSATQALEILALISLSLGVINLFPFLPLDGGHIFWAVAEKVRGRRIPFAVMERAGLAGFALILIVFVIGLSNDVSTLSNGGFHLH